MSRFWNRLSPNRRTGSITFTLSDAGSSNSMGDPFTLNTPLPFLTVAFATAFFFLPKHWTSWCLVYDIVMVVNN